MSAHGRPYIFKYLVACSRYLAEPSVVCRDAMESIKASDNAIVSTMIGAAAPDAAHCHHKVTRIISSPSESHLRSGCASSKRCTGTSG
jgi:hypothetical protein